MPEKRPLPWLYSYEEDGQFMVTASRFAQAVAVESRDTLDERFGTVLSGP